MKTKGKILVTGCGGYIGSVATYTFLQNDYQVVGLDNLTTGYLGPIDYFNQKFPNQFTFYKKDTHDSLTDVFAKEKNITVAVHYAASCMVTESMENPHKYFFNNVCGSENLINELVKNGVHNLVFSSTSEVYGEAEYMPVDEKHPLKPVNPYGLSKRMVEQIIEWYGKVHGLNYVIFRYFNVCGASDDGVIGDSKKPSVLLVQNAVRGALGIERFFLTCPVVDTPDETPIRDYINVVDLNRAHFLAIDYLNKGGASKIINLGTGTGNSVLEIVESVENITKVKIEKERTQPRKGEPAKKIADITKAKRVLGWVPERTLSQSIQSLVKWYQVHPRGWEK